MSTELDTSILELLASKVCHDLISPIGAVNNGIEFMREMGEDAGDEALDLIAYSAQQASAKLQAYRIAYGAGGADGSLKPEDVKNAIDAIVTADGKIKQDWDAYGELGYGMDRPDPYCKMLICALLFAMECLPKGGTINVKGAGEGKTQITASGENAAPRENMVDALELKLDKEALQPKHVHPYVTALLAQKYNFSFSVNTSTADSVIITMSFAVQ